MQIVTVNDYLARRDSEWVGQVHKFLGLEVGLVPASMEAVDRRKAYAADVTYVTNSELGFPLCPQMTSSPGSCSGPASSSKFSSAIN